MKQESGYPTRGPTTFVRVRDWFMDALSIAALERQHDRGLYQTIMNLNPNLSSYTTSCLACAVAALAH